jgi:putative membrane protein
MIQNYGDHAANERTFLAWVRTGIAVIAFGFVIEKFDLFIRALTQENLLGSANRPELRKLTEPLGRYEGLALIIVGAALVAAAAIRFIRTERLLADQRTHSAAGVGWELILSSLLVLIAVGLSVYLTVG